jgi:hypothetical protein
VTRVGRFDREDAREGTGGLPPALGTATQDLRATVEQKLREIVESAEARAHEIEDRALEQALEIEQDSEQRARRRFQSSSERAAQMITAIDAFERETAAALSALRKKGEALAIELGVQPPAAPPEAPETEAPATETPEAEEPASETPTAGPPVPQTTASEAPAPMTTEAPPKSDAATTDLVRESVRKQILDLFMDGKPRAEAERMLGKIEDGGRYSDLLDEVYEGRSETQQGSSRRRGGRRRRRPGSPG